MTSQPNLELLNWYERTFEPSQRGPSGIVRELRRFRDEQDRRRISYCRAVTAQQLISVAWRERKELGIFSRNEWEQVKSFLYRFTYWFKKWNGRIDHRMMWRISGGRRNWSRIRDVLRRRVIFVMDRHDPDEHRCRQWGVVHISSPSPPSETVYAQTTSDLPETDIDWQSEVHQITPQASLTAEPDQFLEPVA